jgi:hypothetical protein
MATTPTPAGTGDAPPNFYAAAAQGAGGAPKAKGSTDDKQEFLTSVTKLLTVLAKMGKLKPNGVDISKEMKAAASAVEQALTKTSGSGDASTSPASDSTGDAQAAASGAASPDTGSTGGAS